MQIRPILDSDREWVAKMMDSLWGGAMIDRAGEFIDALALPGFIAEGGTGPVGLVTLLHEAGSTEIVTINSLIEGKGIGTALMERADAEAKSRGATFLKVFTSNDKLDALRFYQRRGFRFEAIWKDSITEARRTKTTIPTIGQFGIPICDEMELRKQLV